MTTTTPTPALADLDKLEQLARDAANLHQGVTDYKLAGLEFEQAVRHIEPQAFLDLAALARRAAQPVAPVRIDTAVEAMLCDHTKLNEDGLDKYVPQIVALLNHVAVLPAPAEFATPSPQIAEVAELPPLPRKIGTIYPGNYWTASDQAAPPGTGIAEVITVGQALEWGRAIAASRRAVGDAIVPSFDCSLAAVDAYDPQSFINGAKWAQEKLLAAPGSAGQAAPSPIAKLLGDIESIADELEADAMNHEGDFADTVTGCVGALRKLAAQPAEGAGQAGQVAMTEQQVADAIKYKQLITDLGHRALINGDTINASLSLLTRLANSLRV